MGRAWSWLYSTLTFINFVVRQIIRTISLLLAVSQLVAIDVSHLVWSALGRNFCFMTPVVDDG